MFIFKNWDCCPIRLTSTSIDSNRIQSNRHTIGGLNFSVCRLSNQNTHRLAVYSMDELIMEWIDFLCDAASIWLWCWKCACAEWRQLIQYNCIANRGHHCWFYGSTLCRHRESRAESRNAKIYAFHLRMWFTLGWLHLMRVYRVGPRTMHEHTW